MKYKYINICFIYTCSLLFIKTHLQPTDHIQPYTKLLKFSLHFLMLTVEKYHYNLLTELSDLQCSDDFQSKFLAYHIIDFKRNRMLTSGQFPSLISDTQQVVSVFNTIYHCEKLFSKLEYAKSMLHLQLVRCWTMLVIRLQCVMRTMLSFAKITGTYARWPC